MARQHPVGRGPARVRLRGLAWLFAAPWLALATASAQVGETDDDGVALPATGMRVLRFELTPVARAQIAIWIEDADGEFITTVRLTEAVARRGVGNRPGASQMNSGFRWPYGRREAILPIWGMRRATHPEAQLFPRVIFQDRASEGNAARNTDDYSPDNYFCLSFDRERSGREALDAISCASVFSSDKGRYMTPSDVEEEYGEPWEAPDTHEGEIRPLSLESLYPPRRDTARCTDPSCFDHEDVERFAEDARRVMPGIDAVSMATPQGERPLRLLFTVPPVWDSGEYTAWLEVHVEGDSNADFDETARPTPTEPDGAWDMWAITFGYPYRGQPSVVFRVPFRLEASGTHEYTVSEPVGRSSWNPDASEFGTLLDLDGITDDPENQPGKGADRLRMRPDGTRLTLVVEQGECEGNEPPSPVENLEVRRHRNDLHAHEWGRLSFDASSDPEGMLFAYDVRISLEPIVDDESFTRAVPAKEADVEGPALEVPITAAPGERVTVDFGGMHAASRYYIAVRPVDACNSAGEIRAVEHETPIRQFARVDPCFVATAAYGTPLADDVDVLRRLRDQHLRPHPVGHVLVAGYQQVGPWLADRIRHRPWLRAVARTLLKPVVTFADWWQ